MALHVERSAALAAVYQEMRRWVEAEVFEVLLDDVRPLLRELGGRKGMPTSVCLDSGTLQSTLGSGGALTTTVPNGVSDRRSESRSTLWAT